MRVKECNVFGVLDHAEQGHPFAGRQIREIVLFGHDLSFFRLFAAGVMGLQFGPIIRPRVPVVARVLAVQGEQDARVIVAQVDAPVDDPGAHAADW